MARIEEASYGTSVGTTYAKDITKPPRDALHLVGLATAGHADLSEPFQNIIPIIILDEFMINLIYAHLEVDFLSSSLPTSKELRA